MHTLSFHLGSNPLARDKICYLISGERRGPMACSNFICAERLTNRPDLIVKIIQLNEYGCRDAPCETSWKQGNPLSNTIKDTSTIMRNPLSELCREGYA